MSAALPPQRITKALAGRKSCPKSTTFVFSFLFLFIFLELLSLFKERTWGSREASWAPYLWPQCSFDSGNVVLLEKNGLLTLAENCPPLLQTLTSSCKREPCPEWGHFLPWCQINTKWFYISFPAVLEAAGFFNCAWKGHNDGITLLAW